MQEVVRGDPEGVVEVEIIKHLAEGYPTTPPQKPPIVYSAAQGQEAQGNIWRHSPQKERHRGNMRLLEPLA